jgi:hypothetical protein
VVRATRHDWRPLAPVSVALAAWGLLYTPYRGYYAVGGTLLPRHREDDHWMTARRRRPPAFSQLIPANAPRHRQRWPRRRPALGANPRPRWAEQRSAAREAAA